MKKKLLSLLVIFSVSVLIAFPRQGKTSLKDFPKKYRLWLEEEVIYIITPKEKEVFLQLGSDRERDLFIEAFWKQRDPTPGTLENEFKNEHFRRIKYANKIFGWGAPKPGWKTERGRIYIILGEPDTLEKFEDIKLVVNTQVWFYQGRADYGLPNAFNVVFFQKDMVGEYELYSPVRDGPQSLIIGYFGDQANVREAYAKLYQLEPSVARVSLSLVPGESGTDYHPSLFSDVLLSNISLAPQKKVEDVWAEKLLRYKDIVEVEYTANYIDNDSLVKIIQDKSGIFFVHYSIEPKKLSLEFYQNKYYTNLEINGNIADLRGNTIFQFEKTVPFRFNQEELNKIEAKLFSFQDMFPLIEGDYKFHLLVKNTVSKEFTSVEKDISIPKFTSLRMSSLILGYKTSQLSSPQNTNRPFQIGNLQIYSSPRNNFLPQDTIYVFAQIYGLNEELKKNGALEFTFYNGEEKSLSRTKKVSEYEDANFFLEKFSLADLPTATYNIKVSLFDKDKNEVLFEKDYFHITPRVSLPRPWIRSITIPPSNHPIYSYILGDQLLNKKDIEKAKILLEKAYRKNPASLQFAFGFSKALFALKEYKKVTEILKPFLEIQEKNYGFLALLGKSSHALGEFEEAISYYKEYLSHYGTNLNILNSIGECYFQMGNEEEALKAWQKSLEIDPRQQKIKKIVDSLIKDKER